MREFFSNTQQSLDEISKKLDEHIQGVLSSMPGTHKQLVNLRKRIEELETLLKPSKDEDTGDGEQTEASKED